AVGRSFCSWSYRPPALVFATSIATGISTATFFACICFTSTPPVDSGFFAACPTQSATGTSIGIGTDVVASRASGAGRASCMTADASTDFSKIGAVIVRGRSDASTLDRVRGAVTAMMSLLPKLLQLRTQPPGELVARAGGLLLVGTGCLSAVRCGTPRALLGLGLRPVRLALQQRLEIRLNGVLVDVARLVIDVRGEIQRRDRILRVRERRPLPRRRTGQSLYTRLDETLAGLGDL